MISLFPDRDGWNWFWILKFKNDGGTYVVSMPFQSDGEFLQTYVPNPVYTGFLRPLSRDRLPTEGDPVIIHKWNGDGYYEWLNATIYRVRHSLTFDVLLGGYESYIIKAVNDY